MNLLSCMTSLMILTSLMRQSMHSMHLRIMEDGPKHLRTIFCFFSLGLWTMVTPIVLAWIAIEDLLAGTLLSSTVVIISFSIPDIISKIFFPYVVKRISFLWSFALSTSLFVVSVLIVVVAEDVHLRIVGISVHGIASGFTVIVCVRMLAYYEQSDVLASAYQNGEHAAIFLAAVGYTGMTTWLCVPPRIAVGTCIPLSFIPVIFYALLDKNPLEMHLQSTTKNKEDHRNEDKCPESTLSERVHNFTMIFKAFPFISYCFLANFCVHFNMAAVLSTLSFPSSPFPPSIHFQYYRLLCNTGIMAGGMGHLLVSCLCKEFADCIRVRKIWILTFLEVSHVLFFVFASWYRFLPSVVPVLIMCVTQGSVHGMAVVQAHVNAANVFSSESERGTVLGWSQVGLSGGRIAAGFLGVHTETYLREHCTYRLLLGKYCLARYSSYAGWETNLSCSI